MPIKDTEKRRQYNRDRMQKVRSGNTTGNTRLVFTDDSSVLDLGVLEKKRDTLTKLTDYMSSVDKFKPYLKEIRFGVCGCTLDRIKVVLDVVPT